MAYNLNNKLNTSIVNKKMKKVFFIALINSFAFIVNAQTIKTEPYQERTLACTDTIAISKSCDADDIEVLNTKSAMRKTKKGLIKKMLASYKGSDFSAAWQCLTQK